MQGTELLRPSAGNTDADLRVCLVPEGYALLTLIAHNASEVRAVAVKAGIPLLAA